MFEQNSIASYSIKSIVFDQDIESASWKKYQAIILIVLISITTLILQYNCSPMDEQTPYMKHKSLCPRSKLQDPNGHGRFNFVHQKTDRIGNKSNSLGESQYEIHHTVTPGPGDYDLPHQSKHTRLGIILAQHTIYNSIRQPMPGPGRYNNTIPNLISNFRSSPSVVFSPPRLSRFKPEPKTKMPGPGQYKCEKAKKLLSNFSAGRSYSISKTKRETWEVKAATPGPTSYDTGKFYGKGLRKAKSNFKFVHGFPS